MTHVETGTLARVTAPGSRNIEGKTRVIPAIVMGQWPDGSLQLFCFHFEGSFLMNAVPLADVEIASEPKWVKPMNPAKFAA